MITPPEAENSQPGFPPPPDPGRAAAPAALIIPAVDLATSMIASYCAGRTRVQDGPGRPRRPARGRLGPGHHHRLGLELGLPNPDRDHPAAKPPIPNPLGPARNRYSAMQARVIPRSTTIAPPVPLRHRPTAISRKYAARGSPPGSFRQGTHVNWRSVVRRSGNPHQFANP